jgi:hypothetical protein
VGQQAAVHSSYQGSAERTADDRPLRRSGFVPSVVGKLWLSNMAALVRPPAADQPVSAAPLSGGQKRKHIMLASKCKTTTSSDQVITELPSCHGSRNRLNLVAESLAFGRLFEAFQHISQAIRTDATTGVDTQPAKKPRAPSIRRMLAPKYVILLTCILLLVTSVYLF